MKALSNYLLIGLLAGLSVSCNGQSSGNSGDGKAELQEGKVNVVYFHFTRRCATCEAIETESQNAVKEMGDDEVVFLSVNLDDEDNEKLAEELGVSGQTLLIVKGGEQENLTKEAFRYARSEATKFRSLIADKAQGIK